MIVTQPPVFTPQDHGTWKIILSTHRRQREKQICDLFLKGVDILGFVDDEIPDLPKINRILKNRTGFEGVFVTGLEEGGDFFRLLADRKFPVGNFIRDRQDLSYTPAPDVVHDLYGHLPFFTDQAYSDFCQKFGAAASRYSDRPELLRQFERFFWFTIEFGLIKTTDGVRVFGAGIASSTGECDYALSDRPEVFPFEVDRIRHQEFRIDQMQTKLFCLNNTEELYTSLPQLERAVASSTGRERIQ